MAPCSLTRWSIVRTGVLGGAGGALFGLMFASIAAGVIAALVITVATLDPRRTGSAPPKDDGPRTLEIDLDRR